MKFDVFPFAGECTAAEIRRGREEVVASKASVIIGAGGRKVLDAGRGSAVPCDGEYGLVSVSGR
jgi:glycerol dehydrogenase-like iron-containing ADH family enzyme